MVHRIITTAQHYLDMLESVKLINEIVASGETDEESVSTLLHNKNHLITKRAETIWTNEDMTAIDTAIERAKP